MTCHICVNTTLIKKYQMIFGVLRYKLLLIFPFSLYIGDSPVLKYATTAFINISKSEDYFSCCFVTYMHFFGLPQAKTYNLFLKLGFVITFRSLRRICHFR